MTIDLNNPKIEKWLDQFNPADKPSAIELLESIVFVTADHFQQGLTQLLDEVSEEDLSPIALFAERHVPSRDGVPFPLYKHEQGKVRRAVGAGPRPVQPERDYAHATGSEGLISTMITGVKRGRPDKFLDHPGPEDVRKRKPRRFIIATDFIGSGNRVRRYLEAAWRTPSIASWASYKKIRFEVVAYSGTEAGIKHVEKHPFRPTVHVVIGCPSLLHLLSPIRDRLVKLCKNYCPAKPKGETTELGYGNTGALLVFAHGAPNNTPLLLHSTARKWSPLFRSRSTTNLYPGEAEKAEDRIDKTLLDLGEIKLSKVSALQHTDPVTRQTILVLAALKRRPRSMIDASAKTGLPLKVVASTVRRARRAGFLTEDLRLTDAAFNEFAYLRKQTPPRKIDEGDDTDYYPSMLRPPVTAFR